MIQTNNKLYSTITAYALLLFLALFCSTTQARADFLDEVGSVGEEQAKEKEYLKQMRSEMNQINSEISGALNELKQVNQKHQQRANQQIQEFHLFARNGIFNPRKGEEINGLSYNGKVPGPMIRVRQGLPVKIVLHNQLDTSTSLYFHGLKAPHEVNGLPRKGAGIVEKGESFVYQFIPTSTGTFWYHPQVVHANQRLKGLYGVIIVEPNLPSKPYDKDITLLFSKVSSKKVSSKSYAVAPTGKDDKNIDVAFLVNGKQAPEIPAMELRRGDRVKLRLINASDEIVPIHLSGHKLEVISANGADKLEPHVFRDSITLQPSDRVEVEFIANNPGVWSLASELFYQASYNGKFPGGIALVVRYSELKARQQN